MDKLQISWPVKTLGVLVLLFLMLPFFVIVPISFSADQYLRYPPSGLSLQWYERFLFDGNWMNSIVASLQVGVASTVLALILGLPAAIALVRHRIKARMTIYGFILMPMIVPIIITSVALYFVLVRAGLNGTLWAVSLGHAMISVPIVVIILSAALRNYDDRLDHAAASLGAGRLTILYRIMLPIIFPGLVSAALFAFLTSFDDLMIPLFLGGPTAQTLSLRIWNSITLEIEPTIAAVSTFLIGITIAVIALNALIKRPG